MRLQGYWKGGSPKFDVFRRGESVRDPTSFEIDAAAVAIESRLRRLGPTPSLVGLSEVEVRALAEDAVRAAIAMSPTGRLEEVPARDCFVLKRQDVFGRLALAAYATTACAKGEVDLADDVSILLVDWDNTSRMRDDAKIPD